MREKSCNLWLESAEYRCIPSSGAIVGGVAVLDSVIGIEARQRYNDLDADLARLLTSRGNHVHLVRPGVLSFPIKQYDWSGPSLDIIRRSVGELMAVVGDAVTLLPRPVGPADSLSWDEVLPVLSSLPDNVIVIQHA